MHLVGIIIRKFVTMHGHTNVKYLTIIFFSQAIFAGRTSNLRGLPCVHTCHNIRVSSVDRTVRYLKLNLKYIILTQFAMILNNHRTLSLIVTLIISWHNRESVAGCEISNSHVEGRTPALHHMYIITNAILCPIRQRYSVFLVEGYLYLWCQISWHSWEHSHI
jgi:hypothetical protein